MSVQQPLRSIIRTDERRDQRPDQRRSRDRRYWKKAASILLSCLVLFCLLATPASTRFVSQKPVVAPVVFRPVGDPAIVTAPGFDTCVAPPASLLQTWWVQSPYRWLNVYLGGVSMFPTCGGKNLTPEWLRTVYQQGWSMLPTWVGLQAPCAAQHAVMSSNVVTSYTQGVAEADAAIKAASRLGFSSTAPIYFDLEHFNPTRKNGSRDTSCIHAVDAFLNGWESELTTNNHLAGVYASASNYPLLERPTESTPTVAWIAGGSSWAEKYDQACTVYGNKYIADSDWDIHQRIYQYTGGHNETYGKKTWKIDSDCADAPLVGHAMAIPLALPAQHS